MAYHTVDLVRVGAVEDVEVFEVDLRVVEGGNQDQPIQANVRIVSLGGEEKAEVCLVLSEMANLDERVFIAEGMGRYREDQLVLFESFIKGDQVIPTSFRQIVHPSEGFNA